MSEVYYPIAVYKGAQLRLVSRVIGGLVGVTTAAVPPAEQMFVIFPVRMDGIGHGGIFPGNRIR